METFLLNNGYGKQPFHVVRNRINNERKKLQARVEKRKKDFGLK